jgi:hypothetical protein
MFGHFLIVRRGMNGLERLAIDCHFQSPRAAGKDTAKRHHAHREETQNHSLFLMTLLCVKSSTPE